MAFWVLVLWRVQIRVRKALRNDIELYQQHLGVSLALLGAMLNGLFHNAGVFSMELGTISILGVYLAHLNLANRQATRRPMSAQ